MVEHGRRQAAGYASIAIGREVEEAPSEPEPAVEEQLSLFSAEEDDRGDEPPLRRCRRSSSSSHLRPTSRAGSRTARSRRSSECSAKFYARYVAGMRERRRAETALAPAGVGSAVHELLEGIDLAAPAVPADLAALQPDATPEELARIEGFLAAYCDSKLAARISALEGARKEQSFSFEHDGVVLHGFIDVLLARRRMRSSSTSRRTRSREPRPRR